MTRQTGPLVLVAGIVLGTALVWDGRPGAIEPHRDVAADGRSG